MANYRLIFPLLAVVWVCALISGQAEAGEPAWGGEPGGRYEAGFVTGAGSGPIDHDRYTVALFIAHFGYNIKTAPQKADRSGIFSLFIEPQVNPVFSPRDDYEAGVGFGVQYLYPLTENLRPYLLASVGPHYISYNSESQSPGFNFLLTAGAGFYYFLDKKTALNLGWRFRHISNAGLRRPNDGLNIHCGVAGLSFFF